MEWRGGTPMPGPYPPSLPPDHAFRRYTRRAVLRLATAGSFARIATPKRLLADEPTGRRGERGQPLALELGPGPQLFLDDHLVDRFEGLERHVEPPERLEQPVLDSPMFGCTQPYVTVIRDEPARRFRLWYNRGSAIWHAESADGRHWENPRV